MSLAIQPLPQSQLSEIFGSLDEIAKSLAEEITPQELEPPERRAVVLANAIQILNSFEVMVNLAKGRVLAEYVDDQIYRFHPEGYESDVEAYESLGLSASEACDYKAMAKHVFPWLRKIGEDPMDWFHRIGKSKFRRILPFLRPLADPQYETSDKIKIELDRIRKSVISSNPFATNIEEEMARWILSMAETHTVRALDQELKLKDAPAILFFYRCVIEEGQEEYEVSSVMSQVQFDILRRQMGSLADFIQEEPWRSHTTRGEPTR